MAEVDEKDDLMARTMVENLSIGIDPLTGRALPPTDICSNEVVQEALQAVLRHCTLESYASILERQRKEKEAAAKTRRDRQAALYPRTGQSWSKKEDEQLYALYYYHKNSVGQIAHILKRSPSSVITRLKKYRY